MQHVYTARDSLDANFLKGLLEQEGINSVVQGEPLQETWGSLPLTDESLPSVWVSAQDVPQGPADRRGLQATGPGGRGGGRVAAATHVDVPELWRKGGRAVHPMLALRPQPARCRSGGGTAIA